MKHKLLLCLTLVLSGFSARIASQETNNWIGTKISPVRLSDSDIQDIKTAVLSDSFRKVVEIAPLSDSEALVSTAPNQLDSASHIEGVKKWATGWHVVMEGPMETMCDEYLFDIGPKLGCCFTLEYQGYALTGKSPEIYKQVTNDLSVSSIPALMSKLRRDLTEFDIEQDIKNPSVLHIIERILNRQKGYTLNKRISLRYSGNLVGCDVKDAEGRNLVKGEGLPAAISRKIGNIKSGTTESGSGDDCFTVVNLDATDETVRSILTDYLPLTNYSVILWRAETTSELGKTKVLIQFYGTKHPRFMPSPPATTNVSNQIVPNTGLPPGHILIDPITGLPLKRGSGPITDGLQMSLSVSISSNQNDPEFEVAVRNVGDKDVCLNLGTMLANGKVMIPDKIHLIQKNSNGERREFDFAVPPAISGRVDDYMVPLRAGSSYVLKLRLDQFVSPTTGERMALKPGRYEVWAQFYGDSGTTSNLDMAGMKLMNFWKGRLQSNVVTIVER